MGQETPKGLGLDMLMAVWRRRKRLAILSFAALFSAAASVTAFLPNIYQATAKVLVVSQQVPVEFVRTTVTGSVDTRLQTISQQILSRSRLEELIDRFGLYPNVRAQFSPEALVDHMRRDIEVRPTGVDRGGSMVAFTIRYQGREPETVARVTNTLASYYIDENMKVRERQATGTAEFLQAQLAEVKNRLEVHERHVSDFRRRHLGELPTQMDANLATLERLNTQFRLNGEKQIRARELRQQHAKLLESLAIAAVTATARAARVQPAPVPPDADEVRLSRLKQELADLRTRFSDKYPDVRHLMTEIAVLELQIAQAKPARALPQTAPAPPEEPVAPLVDPSVVQMQQALSQLDVELKTLKEEEDHLRAAMATYQSRVDNTPRRDMEFQELSRDYDSTRDLYRTLLKRYEEAQLSESLEQRQKGEQFRILEPALVPGEPAAPNRIRFLVLALALSVGSAVSLVVLAEKFDTSFHTGEDLGALTNAPVLVSIPCLVTDSDLRRRRWRARFTAAAAVVGIALIVGASYFVATENEQLLRLLTQGRS